MRLTVRYRWEPRMADETPQQNRFDTATVMGLVSAWLVVLEDYYTGWAVWLQAHTPIVLSPGHGVALKAAVVGTLTALIARWHTGTK